MISLVTSFSGLCQFEEIPFPGFGFQGPRTKGVDVTVLGLVGGAPGGETPRVADSSAAGAVLAVCKTLGIEGRQFGNEPV